MNIHTIYISGNEASGGDSSDEEKLEIVEDDQNLEFDKKLEDKSSKFSLSVMNVKSIIHVRISRTVMEDLLKMLGVSWNFINFKASVHINAVE